MLQNPRRHFARSVALAGVLTVGLFSSLLVGTANAAATTVTGTVKTSGGTAVAGVKVSIKVGAAQADVGTTNASGAFSIPTQTGAATIELTSPSASVAGLPQVWSVKGISTTIGAGAVLNFALPATKTITAIVSPNGVPVQGAAITQCSADNDAASPAVVLAGTAAVAPTQDFNGATTNASGQAALSVFADTTFGRLCGAYTQTSGGTVTDFVARSGVKDTAAVSTMTLFVPSPVPQTGTVKDNLGNGKAGLKVAFRSGGGQVDSTSAPTTAAGAFSTLIAPGNVFARFSSRSLSNTVAPPTNIPRSFKATVDGSSTGAAWNVQLPATVTLTVRVQNPDGTPVSNAVVRPATVGGFDAANSASIVAGQPNAQLTQQIYGDNLSGGNGEVYVRLFADSSLGSFKVSKNIGGGQSRQTTVAAGTVLTSNNTITVTLPK